MLNPTNRQTVVRSRPLARALHLSAVAALALMLGGCTTGLGPAAIHSERPDFNRQIVRSTDEQMLMNLVRLRYNDTPLFLELGTVVASYSYDVGLSASGSVYPAGKETAGLGGSASYAERPTITYTPLSGDEYAERLLTPIVLESIMLFNQTGWSAERLLLLTVQRMNNITNAPTATGPTPKLAPNYEKFHDLASRIRRLQLAGIVGLDWDIKRDEKITIGHRSCMWFEKPPEGSPLMEDYLEVHKLLELDPARTSFHLTAFPFDRQPGEVGIRCRSLLGVLYFLSQSVEAPKEHEEKGLVTVTKDHDGKPFDWDKCTGDLIKIHSQQFPPLNAAVAIEHRGWWFYIADNDLNSKATLNLLNILFSLQSASGKGKSPVLTLPIGK